MRRISLFILLVSSIISFAQRGKNGNVTISSAEVVNEYTTLTANAGAGNTSITVAASGLNTKSRFTGNLSIGDLIMIIQVQGTTINGRPHYWWEGPVNIGVACRCHVFHDFGSSGGCCWI